MRWRGPIALLPNRVIAAIATSIPLSTRTDTYWSRDEASAGHSHSSRLTPGVHEHQHSSDDPQPKAERESETEKACRASGWPDRFRNHDGRRRAGWGGQRASISCELGPDSPRLLGALSSARKRSSTPRVGAEWHRQMVAPASAGWRRAAVETRSN